MPRQPDYSAELRGAVCHTLTGILSQEQIGQLDRGEHVRFARGCDGDATITAALQSFKQAMRRNARAQTITRKEFMIIARKWMHRYSRQGMDGMRSIRKKRMRLTPMECEEAADILCTPVEHNDGCRLWRSADHCLEQEHEGQARFRCVSGGSYRPEQNDGNACACVNCPCSARYRKSRINNIHSFMQAAVH